MTTIGTNALPNPNAQNTLQPLGSKPLPQAPLSERVNVGETQVASTNINSVRNERLPIIELPGGDAPRPINEGHSVSRINLANKLTEAKSANKDPLKEAKLTRLINIVKVAAVVLLTTVIATTLVVAGLACCVLPGGAVLLVPALVLAGAVIAGGVVVGSTITSSASAKLNKEELKTFEKNKAIINEAIKLNQEHPITLDSKDQKNGRSFEEFMNKHSLDGQQRPVLEVNNLNNYMELYKQGRSANGKSLINADISDVKRKIDIVEDRIKLCMEPTSDLFEADLKEAQMDRRKLNDQLNTLNKELESAPDYDPAKVADLKAKIAESRAPQIQPQPQPQPAAINQGANPEVVDRAVPDGAGRSNQPRALDTPEAANRQAVDRARISEIVNKLSELGVQDPNDPQSIDDEIDELRDTRKILEDEIKNKTIPENQFETNKSFIEDLNTKIIDINNQRLELERLIASTPPQANIPEARIESPQLTHLNLVELNSWKSMAIPEQQSIKKNDFTNASNINTHEESHNYLSNSYSKPISVEGKSYNSVTHYMLSKDIDNILNNLKENPGNEDRSTRLETAKNEIATLDPAAAYKKVHDTLLLNANLPQDGSTKFLLFSNMDADLKTALWSKFIDADGQPTPEGQNLIATGDKTIYAVQELGESHGMRLNRREEYEGKNELGQCLMELREILIAKQSSIEAPKAEIDPGRTTEQIQDDITKLDKEIKSFQKTDFEELSANLTSDTKINPNLQKLQDTRAKLQAELNSKQNEAIPDAEIQEKQPQKPIVAKGPEAADVSVGKAPAKKNELESMIEELGLKPKTPTPVRQLPSVTSEVKMSPEEEKELFAELEKAIPEAVVQGGNQPPKPIAKGPEAADVNVGKAQFQQLKAEKENNQTEGLSKPQLTKEQEIDLLLKDLEKNPPTENSGVPLQNIHVIEENNEKIAENKVKVNENNNIISEINDRIIEKRSGLRVLKHNLSTSGIKPPFDIEKIKSDADALIMSNNKIKDELTIKEGEYRLNNSPETQIEIKSLREKLQSNDFQIRHSGKLEQAYNDYFAKTIALKKEIRVLEGEVTNLSKDNERLSLNPEDLTPKQQLEEKIASGKDKLDSLKQEIKNTSDRFNTLKDSNPSDPEINTLRASLKELRENFSVTLKSHEENKQLEKKLTESDLATAKDAELDAIIDGLLNLDKGSTEQKDELKTPNTNLPRQEANVNPMQQRIALKKEIMNGEAKLESLGEEIEDKNTQLKKLKASNQSDPEINNLKASLKALNADYKATLNSLKENKELESKLAESGLAQAKEPTAKAPLDAATLDSLLDDLTKDPLSPKQKQLLQDFGIEFKENAPDLQAIRKKQDDLNNEARQILIEQDPNKASKSKIKASDTVAKNKFKEADELGSILTTLTESRKSVKVQEAAVQDDDIAEYKTKEYANDVETTQPSGISPFHTLNSVIIKNKKLLETYKNDLLKLNNNLSLGIKIPNETEITGSKEIREAFSNAVDQKLRDLETEGKEMQKEITKNEATIKKIDNKDAPRSIEFSSKTKQLEKDLKVLRTSITQIRLQKRTYLDMANLITADELKAQSLPRMY